MIPLHEGQENKFWELIISTLKDEEKNVITNINFKSEPFKIIFDSQVIDGLKEFIEIK